MFRIKSLIIQKMEPRQYEDRGKALKRVAEEVEQAEKELPTKKKIEDLWEYIEQVKEMQSLEVKLDLLKKKVALKEKKTPDLKNLRGNIDHMALDRFFEVKVDNLTRVLPGKSYKEAEEKYRKKMDQDKKNADKQKKKTKEMDVQKDS